MHRNKFYPGALTVLLSVFVLSQVGWGQTPAVSVAPVTRTVAPATTFTLDVRIDNVTSLAGASIRVAFDNTLLQFNTATQGPFLAGSPFFFVSPSGTPVSSVLVDQTVPSGSAQSGSGVLFVISLTTLNAIGTSPVTVTVEGLRSADNQTIPSVVISGEVRCAVAQVPVVSVTPTTKNVLPSTAFTLDVRIDNVTGLSGASIRVNFDRSVLEFVAALQGPFLTSTSPLFFVTPSGTPVNSVLVDQSLPGSDARSGSGVLAQLTFRTLAQTGTSPVTVVVEALRDAANQPISSTVTSGQVVCGNPLQTFVDPAYTAVSAGGHDFGFDAFVTVTGGVNAVVAGGTVNIASAVYGESVSIGKDVTLSGSGVPRFQGITVNTPSVVLGGGLEISGSLSFGSGNLFLGDNDLMLAGTVSGAGPGKCIVSNGAGSVRRTISSGPASAFRFPVAPAADRFNPLTIELAPGDPTDVFAVRVLAGVNPVAPDTSLCVFRTWDINEADPGSLNHARLTFQWTADENGSNIILPGVGVYHYSGAAYALIDLPNESGTGTPADPYVAPMSGFAATSFSSYVIGAPGGLPIQLTSFSWSMSDGRVALRWTTASETNNYGFYVERREGDDGLWTALPNGFVAGHGTTALPQVYAFTDPGQFEGEVQYRLRQVDLDGTVHFTEALRVTRTTDVHELIPARFALLQNYPNPFNPTTAIRYELASASDVRLTVFDELGRAVAVLVNETQEAGAYLVRFDAAGLASGIYIYRLQASSFSATKRFLLLK